MKHPVCGLSASGKNMVQNGAKRRCRHKKRHTHHARIVQSQDDGPQWLAKPATGKRKSGKSKGRPHRRSDDPMHAKIRSNADMSPETTHRSMATVQAATTKHGVLN